MSWKEIMELIFVAWASSPLLLLLLLFFFLNLPWLKF